MKFFSRSNIYLVVLENGIAPNRLAGVAGKQTAYIKFEDGVAFVPDTDVDTIEKMKTHKAFGTTFWIEDEDPFKTTRKSSEPRHAIDQIEHGVAGKSLVSTGNPTELQKMIMEQAKLMATEIVKEILNKTEVAKEKQIATEETREVIPDVKEDKSQTKKYTLNGVPVTLMEAAQLAEVDYGKMLSLVRFKKMSVDEAVVELTKS